jgi:CheY-like chemotaxis protein
MDITPAALAQSNGTSQPCDLLLVEDNPLDLEIALRSFRKAGGTLHIQVARDGAEALDFVFGEGRHAGRRLVDAPRMILLDLKLPKVDGLEVLARLKADERTRHIPVVMLTTSSQQRDLLKSYQLGVNSYLVKPVALEDFVRLARQVTAYWLELNQPMVAGS